MCEQDALRCDEFDGLKNVEKFVECDYFRVNVCGGSKYWVAFNEL